MQDAVQVEIVQRTVPADDQTRAWRRSVVDRMAELGQVDDPQAGSVGAPLTFWVARIGGAEVPLNAYSVDQDGDGAPLLTLLFTPDSLRIGTLPDGGDTFTPVAAPLKNSGSWGDSEALQKPLGEQVAARAERIALRTTTETAPMVWLNRSLGNEGGPVAVTA